jgi:hypothetical protein
VNIDQVTKAIAPLVKLAQAELRQEMAVERNEWTRKYRYIEAQRNKWKAEALKYRKQLIERSKK